MSTVGSLAATDNKLEPKVLVRKLKELRLEKDRQLSTALLALGLADKVGEQEAVKTHYTWNGTRTVLREEKVGVLAWHTPSWSVSSHLSVLSLLAKHV